VVAVISITEKSSPKKKNEWGGRGGGKAESIKHGKKREKKVGKLVRSFSAGPKSILRGERTGGGGRFVQGGG